MPKEQNKMDYFMQEAKIKRRIQEIEALRYRNKR